MKRRNRLLTWVLAALVALIAVLVIVTATFDWNRAKPYVNARVSEAIGRPFAIQGNLAVHWRRDAEHGDLWPGPVFTAEDIAIANPEWAREKQFAHLKQVQFRLSLWPLLAHRVRIARVQLGEPDVHLQQQADRKNNWTFTPAASDGAPSTWTLDLGEIGFDTGRISVHDAADRIDVDVAVQPLGKPIPFSDIVGQMPKGAAADSARARRAQDYAFAFKATGSYNGARVSGSGKTGGLLALRGADLAFPLQADVRIGDVRIVLAGSITDPASPDALDLSLRLAGDSMAHLYPVLGVALPDTPPFETDGHLHATLRKGASAFAYDAFNGKVGASDLHGSVTFAQGGARPGLSGKLWSERISFADLGPLIGLDTGDKHAASEATPAGGKDTPTRPRNGKVLPTDTFATDRWRAMDTDIAFNGKSIVRAGSLPISDLQAHVVMDDGRLALDPLDFGLAGGAAKSRIHLDGRSTPMRGDIRLDGRGFRLRELFPAMKTMQDALGEVNASMALSATGNSVAALLGSSNGELKLLMSDGVVSRELMELAGLNVGNYVVVKLFGDENVRVNCAATDFEARDGVLSSRVAVFDTQNALINIDGSVNFRDETLALDITPHTKGLRIFSLRSPLYVKGTFAEPNVGVHAGNLILRGGGALALGVFAAPAAALLPLIAPSKDADASPCAGLLAQMQGKATAPPAGKAAKAADAKPAAATKPQPAAKAAQKTPHPPAGTFSR